ncbi:MAG: molybdopterin adenylyltransferase, partial [Betaproteobacteria bacterium]|nr:molybdopterin adenylyltransferase [Betaproteobacteria bacterium]
MQALKLSDHQSTPANLNEPLRIGLLSVSDRASKGIYEDRGLPSLRDWLGRAISTPFQLIERLIPDDQAGIASSLCELCDQSRCHLILTTGGTGPSRRDLTPEATIAVSTREMPGFGEQMRQISLRFVPTAILSRQVGALRELDDGHSCLIVNLPGQPKAIAETLGKTVLAHDELATRLGLDGVKPLFLSIAREEISNRAIENAIRFGPDQDSEGLNPSVSAALHQQVSWSPPSTGQTGRPLKVKTSGRESAVLVDGVASLLNHLAGCCRPIPPDDIAGFITRGEGVSVHRVICSTYGRLLARHPERAVQVSWAAGAGNPPNAGLEHGQSRKASDPAAFAAELLLRANDRPGLLRDLTELMSRLKI